MDNCCPKCGNTDIAEFSNGVKKCYECGWIHHDAIKLEKEKLDVLYICNKERCEHCTWPVCQHTTDIKYAANFVNEDGYYKEIVRKGEE